MFNLKERTLVIDIPDFAVYGYLSSSILCSATRIRRMPPITLDTLPFTLARQLPLSPLGLTTVERT